jgi:hypothetical protein
MPVPRAVTLVPPSASEVPIWRVHRGVAIDRETGIVYASDVRSGLWIMRPTGAAAAS